MALTAANLKLLDQETLTKEDVSKRLQASFAAFIGVPVSTCKLIRNQIISNTSNGHHTRSSGTKLRTENTGLAIYRCFSVPSVGKRLSFLTWTHLWKVKARMNLDSAGRGSLRQASRESPYMTCVHYGRKDTRSNDVFAMGNVYMPAVKTNGVIRHPVCSRNTLIEKTKNFMQNNANATISRIVEQVDVPPSIAYYLSIIGFALTMCRRYSGDRRIIGSSDPPCIRKIPGSGSDNRLCWSFCIESKTYMELCINQVNVVIKNLINAKKEIFTKKKSACAVNYTDWGIARHPGVCASYVDVTISILV